MGQVSGPRACMSQVRTLASPSALEGSEPVTPMVSHLSWVEAGASG